MSSEYDCLNLPSDLTSLDCGFDPAIELHSEEPSQSFSDDIAALEAQRKELVEEKNRQGIVIQHRAWKLQDIFQSEEDFPTATPTRSRNTCSFASSPPTMDIKTTRGVTVLPVDMESDVSARKRRRLEGGERSPLKEISENSRKFVFFESVSDDEDEHDLPHKPSAIAGPIPTLNEPNENVHETIIEDCNASFPPARSTENDPPSSTMATSMTPLTSIIVQTLSGKSLFVGERLKPKSTSYNDIVASRSVTEEGRAKTSYYGIAVHELLEDIANQKAIAEAQASYHPVTEISPVRTVEASTNGTRKKRKAGLWCDRYRAHKFTDLVGDDRTHRSVLHWLKKWDSVVFPGLRKKKFSKQKKQMEENLSHRKILILAGPPGLGKTTLAHVCAKQAGYEVHEINGSDDRTAKVVKEQISDMLGTENVRGISTKTTTGIVRKAGKPQCIVVDEVDGVAGGSGRDEAGFIKALLDLVQLDQKNSVQNSAPARNGNKKFRMLRPLILVCNDLYHPSLRSLRQSSLAEIIHMRKPPINAVISRLHSIFEREGVPSDEDGVRRLCEATWGVSTKKDSRSSSGTAVGDIRSVLVVGEWVATKFRQTSQIGGTPRLTKAWIEENIICELSYGGGAARSLGRGSTKEVVERVFQEDAGFLKSESAFDSKNALETVGVVGVTEAAKRRAITRLNEMVYTSGETDRIVTGKRTFLETEASSHFHRLLHVLSIISHSG
jgi:chromosome transmission fidelity protein 18